MEKISAYLILILILIVFIQLLFYSILGFFGLFRPVRDYEILEDKFKFLFLIPACNEENVIRDTLKKIKSLNYKKELFSATCLVNNSSDNTFNIASDYTRTLDIKFNQGEPKGKPYVLQKYFNNESEWRNYDYIVILDADNIINKNFLKEMNSQILTYGRENVTVVQGYLGIKNILTSFMSSGYSASYFVANRTIQYAKHRLGLNSTIGGTGFSLNTDYIKEHGWNPRTYTEDFELQVELVLANKRTLWNHQAIVYDEKPNSILASHKQRLRWSQGHWRVAFSTLPKQLIGLFKIKSTKDVLNRLETLIYSFAMMRSPITILIILLGLINPVITKDIPRIWSFLALWLVLELINYFIFPIVCILTEGKIIFTKEVGIPVKMIRFFRIYIAFFYSAIVYVAAQVQGLFTCFLPQVSWDKTVHNMSEKHVIYGGEDNENS